MLNKINLSDFKPSDMRKQVLTTKELINKLQLDDVEHVNADYNEGKWTLRQMSRYIESLLMNLPQEPIIADGSFGNWFIIKGVEQINAISRFVTGRFKLNNIYFRPEVYTGKLWSDLSLTSRQKINNLSLDVYVVNKNVEPNTRFGLYMLLNPATTYKRMADYRKMLFPEGFKIFDSWLKDKIEFYDNDKSYLRDQLPRLELALLHLLLLYKYSHELTSKALLNANIEYASNYTLINLQHSDLESFYEEFSLSRLFSNGLNLYTLTKFRASMKAETYLISNTLGIKHLEQSFKKIWDTIYPIIKGKDSSLENMLLIRDTIKQYFK